MWCYFISQTPILRERKRSCVFACMEGETSASTLIQPLILKWGPSSSISLQLLPSHSAQRQPSSFLSSHTLILFLILSCSLIPSSLVWAKQTVWMSHCQLCQNDFFEFRWMAKWHYEILTHLSWRIIGQLVFQHLTVESGAYSVLS